jgi:solute carrier family 6 (neurotransmitter transporter, glycine) member 5/9
LDDDDEVSLEHFLLSFSNPAVFNSQSDEDRPTWTNGMEFLMSCISMSVGLGNVWRFPFTAYENGGGAFLIPYIIVLIVIGRPMYFLEMILGQFTSRGSVRIWEMTPILKGIGIGQLVGTACVLTYYCSLIGLTLFYMFSSFATELPWAKCVESWGANCVDSGNSMRNINRTLTAMATHGRNKSVSSSELYFL